jgi:hypothetical protein
MRVSAVNSPQQIGHSSSPPSSSGAAVALVLDVDAGDTAAAPPPLGSARCVDEKEGERPALALLLFGRA